ncbi:uncharacterized protein LOC132755801 [Ruditapes philippinarum]|uniref:uncharacterized protein LOC132755801 n=1 Tax=Ruditapes philippinarum TaxID=129788 RepID=UPI00295B22C0|nr:uncharacterized protein LOC132755801 [Ruditapes philippinarum]
MSNLKDDVCFNSQMSENMEKGKKVNWSADERDMLISKCEDATVATGKFSSSLTAADKVRFWVDVTESVNSVSGCSRTLEQVKKKWIDLKSQTKKKTIQYIAETRKTGGGPAPILDLEAWESKILQTIPTCSVEGIKNGADTFLENNDPGLAIPDLPVGSETNCDNEPVPKKAKYDRSTIEDSEPSLKRAKYDNASTRKSVPEANTSRDESHRVEELVIQQTAVMRDLVAQVSSLNENFKTLNANFDKLLNKLSC